MEYILLVMWILYTKLWGGVIWWRIWSLQLIKFILFSHHILIFSFQSYCLEFFLIELGCENENIVLLPFSVIPQTRQWIVIREIFLNDQENLKENREQIVECYFACEDRKLLQAHKMDKELTLEDKIKTLQNHFVELWALLNIWNIL